MKRYKKETRYVSVLTVHVPDVQAFIDMLRYDRCCPATEDESRKIWRLLNEEAVAEDRIVRLHRFAANDLPATEGRWRSFGCRVLDERSPDIEQLTDAQALQILKFQQAVDRR